MTAAARTLVPSPARILFSIETSTTELGQRVGNQPGAGNHHVLLPVCAPVDHRSAANVEARARSPQLFSGHGVEGAELLIRGAADEDHAAARRHRRAGV